MGEGQELKRKVRTEVRESGGGNNIMQEVSAFCLLNLCLAERGGCAGRHVRGLCIATGQYSSFCGCALGLVLGALDNMEVEVLDREQVEVREKVEARETEEEDKTRKQQTLRHVMTCG